jgi:hypothetical protein
VGIKATVIDNTSSPQRERIYTYTGKISELDTGNDRQINIAYLNPFGIKLAADDSFTVEDSTGIELFDGFTLSANPSSLADFITSIDLDIESTVTNPTIMVDGATPSPTATTITASDYTLGQHVLTLSGTSTTTGRPISKTIHFTVVR